MAPAYKVAELLALRDSVSESAVSIERFADEDVIKEHVLRPTASAAANLAGRSSNKSLRPPVVSVAGTNGLEKKPSPSPSIKRGKAEKLLKEHGSPPGLRVTAGGRIVPSDLAALGTSRFGDAFKQQPLRVSPGNALPAQYQSNNNTARIEVVGGQPVVVVGDRIFALPAVNISNSTPTMQSEIPNTTESIAKSVSNMPNLSTHGTAVGGLMNPSAGGVTPFVTSDLPSLKAQQTFKKQELRTVEQTEVLQASHQPESWRIGMIERKRSLIVELDTIRKQIAALEAENKNNISTSSFTGPTAASSGSAAPFTNAPQHTFTQGAYGFPTVNPYAPVMMYGPQPFASFQGYGPTEPAAIVPPIAVAPHSPGSASRRSHAIEIKPPPDHFKKQLSSALDPKSPTYEPSFKPSTAQDGAPPTPSPSRRAHWQLSGQEQFTSHNRQGLPQKLSLSSIDTTDFFPTNTHEHSSTRVAPLGNENVAHSHNKAALPSTPEKLWPASPWNENHSGRSKQNEPATKLTSWPEAFGKQPSSASLRKSTTTPSVSAVFDRAPASSVGKTVSAMDDETLMQTSSGRRTGTDENLPFSSKAIVHTPSTWQEGYQAGYDHVGIPNSPDVLQGYVQGLLHFLADESKKRQDSLAARLQYMPDITSNSSSLRGLVANSTPHDSAVSISFDRTSLPSRGVENVRSPGGASLLGSRHDAVYSPNGTLNGNAARYALQNEPTRESGQRVASTAKFSIPTTVPSESATIGPRSALYSDIEYGTYKGDLAHAGSFQNSISSRKGFGDQLQNRGYETLQRVYPAPRDASTLDALQAGYANRQLGSHRMSGLDGAMDDLSEMVNDTSIGDTQPAPIRSSMEVPVLQEPEETQASCFKSTGGKGKQKGTSPSKSALSGREEVVSPSGTLSNSPKKSGEHSPAKVKLEQVTNKFRRVKKDEARILSPEEKVKRSDKWRARFRELKKTEVEEIEEHRRNNRV